jgi:hypothetical protein
VAKRSTPLLTALLTLLVSGSLLAVGTVHVTTLQVIAPIAIVAGAIAIWVEDQRLRRWPVPALIAILLTCFTLFQALPLPPSWAHWLSPVSARTWTDAFKLLGSSPAQWTSISVDPGASRVEALKWLSYAAAFIASARVAREVGSQRGTAIVVGSALLAGVLSVIHGLFGVEDWMGLYHPQMAHPPWAPAPLLNPNNFAGYLNLGVFAGMGLIFVRRPIAPRWVLAFTAAVLSALVILTASRGGVLALVVGFGVSGVAYRFQQLKAKKRGGFVFPSWIPVAGLGVAALSLALIGATDLIWQQLRDETTGKLRIIEYSLPVIRDHFWTGIGRGCFETAFPAYRREPGHFIAQYAENFVVQWIVEWGFPVAAAALVGLLLSLRPRRVGFARNALPTGALIGIAVLLLQNLVDLATEVASVGLAVAVLLGSMQGGADYFEGMRERTRNSRRQLNGETSLVESNRDRPGRAKVPSVAALALLGAGAFVFGLVARTAHPDAIDQRTRLSASLSAAVGKTKEDPALASLRGEIDKALLRHPADPFVPIVGALLAREVGKTPMAWLGHALRRDPMNARAHLLLAETLAARGAMPQAMLELRHTDELGPELRNAVAERAVRWTQNIEDLLRAVPEGEKGVPLLNALALRFAGSPERQQLRDRLLALSLQRNERDAGTNTIFAQDLMASISSNSPDCAGDRRAACSERLRRHAALVVNESRNRQTTTLMRAKLLDHDQKYDEAERLLAENCQRLPDPVSCGIERVTYALKLKDARRFDDAAAEYTASACSTPAGCAQAFTWLGNLELGRNNQLGALARFERAAQESPSSDAWLRVAEVATRVGRLARAETALVTAKRLGLGEAAQPVEERLRELQRSRTLENLSHSSGWGKRP